MPTETLVPGATRTRPIDGMIMVYIPDGEFLKGSDDTDREAETNEKPQRTANVDGFWIDRTEVTVAQFRAFVQATATVPRQSNRVGRMPTFDDGYKYTAPAGSYPTGASPYGVLDMAGNVWEWTTSRMLRGGSWNHNRAGMRAAYRLEASPDTCVDNFGFRCVLQPGN